MAIDFNKTSLVIITGASQGIGQKISQVIASKFKKAAKIVLIARSEHGLLETKRLVQLANKDVCVEIILRDLSKPDYDDYNNIFAKLENTYENAIIFHNAGQVGLLKNTTGLNDLELWRSYYDLNMFSTALLNSAFIKKFRNKKLYVINITSLCGRQAFANMALYGSAKAARDLYFSVLAKEETDIVVLQYSPGPVDTAMFNEVANSADNPDVRSQFLEMKEKNLVLTTDCTVEKLFALLEGGSYKSGDIRDFFDV